MFMFLQFRGNKKVESFCQNLITLSVGSAFIMFKILQFHIRCSRSNTRTEAQNFYKSFRLWLIILQFFFLISKYHDTKTVFARHSVNLFIHSSIWHSFGLFLIFWWQTCKLFSVPHWLTHSWTRVNINQNLLQNLYL
jgi:hypothetical protein